MDDLLNARFPHTVEIPIWLDDDPRYKGSIHDDAVARARGYKAALIPGAFVYGHISRLAVDAWGADWAERGGMKARFRRPVYNGDVLTIAASALTDDGTRVQAAISASNGDGEEVAVGWIALPHERPTPPALANLPVLPASDAPPAVEAGGLAPSMRLTTKNRVLSQEDYERSLKAFDERHPFYADSDVVHSGCLIRLTMGDANGSFRLPAAVVFTEGEAQHYGLVRPGMRLATSGRVTDAYVRKGKHYFDSEEYLIAEGTEVMARFRRTSIYAYD